MIPRLLIFYKIIITGMMMVAGIFAVHLNDFAGEDYGVKAAILALGAAAAWFVDRIPGELEHDPLYRDDWFFRWAGVSFTRLTGAAFAVLAGWNWLMDETNGDVLTSLWSVLAVLLLVIPPIVGGSIYFILLHVRKWKNS